MQIMARWAAAQSTARVGPLVRRLTVRSLPKIAVAALLAMPAAAHAEEVGNVEAGHAYAKKVCAECHAVERGEKESPYLDLPSFQTVADSAGITERALAVWLQNPLPS